MSMSPFREFLVRYGAVPEVALFRAPAELRTVRGGQVVVVTHRGQELGTILEPRQQSAEPGRGEPSEAVIRDVVRPASADDLQRGAALRREAEGEFSAWQRRIADWNVDVQLIDLEWMLDRSKLILYVLNERGPECTRLALHAAAEGLGVVEVQPVSLEGLAPPPPPSSGCGSCGCHT
jgi:cell fate regulator YaaT (PSP1 superfamily)